MSVTNDIHAFDRTISDLKQGVQTAAATQTKGAEAVAKHAKDMAAFGQGTLEAMLQASQIFAAGAQDLAKQMAELSQSAMTETMANLKALSSAKTPKEALDLQATIVRTSSIRAVSEASRFAHAGIELAEKAAAPISARLVLAAETATSFKV